MKGIQAYYFGARYYDPEIGIFTSTDPAGQAWNSFAYCAGNPINLRDPSGMIVQNINAEQEKDFLFNASNADIEYYAFGLCEVKQIYQWNNVFFGWLVTMAARANVGIDYSVMDCSKFVRTMISQVTGEEMSDIYNSTNVNKYSNLSSVDADNAIWGDVLQWVGHVAIHDPTSNSVWRDKHGNYNTTTAGYLKVNIGAHKAGYSTGYYPNDEPGWWGTPSGILRVKQ
jgi:hypothetical protein